VTAQFEPSIPKRSFPPIADARARVLVLGTLPGEESLRRREYYAHPRNLFWPIVFALFGAKPATDYAERLAFVAARRIALWDVCEFAEREASADTAIRAERPNAIDRLPSTAPARGGSTTATLRGEPSSPIWRSRRRARRTRAWTLPPSWRAGRRCARCSPDFECGPKTTKIALSRAISIESRLKIGL